MIPSFLFLLTLAPSSTLAKTTVAIRNSIYEFCSPNPVPNSKSISDFGCGSGLICKKFTNPTSTYHQCQANAALESTIWDTCPETTCAKGSFCYNYDKVPSHKHCRYCRTEYVTCGPSIQQVMQPYGCCPGMLPIYASLSYLNRILML